MAQKIYGVDPGKEITAIMARDAIIECFYQAHCLESRAGGENEEFDRAYCRTVVERAFRDAGGDFNRPDKKSIVGAMDYLAEFSRSFRSQEIIKKHYNEIMALVNKL